MSAKPALPANLRDIATAAKARHRERFAVPQLAADPNGFGWRWGCPYREEDHDDWQALLFEAFGTRSISVVETFLSNLARLCDQQYSADAEGWRPDIMEMNTALAIMASAKPADEMQACIAAQMVALHITAMKLGGVIGQMTLPDERTAATMARVSKSYACLARTLAQLQGKATRHEQHFHYHADHHVHAGGGSHFGGQAHACPTDIERRYTYDANSVSAVAALPSPCANDRRAMPSASSEGQARVQDARWWPRLRRALGRS